MADTTVTKALKDYFNSGDGVSVASEGGQQAPATVAGIPEKRGAKEFLLELRALTADEKHALAQDVCAVTGDTLT